VEGSAPPIPPQDLAARVGPGEGSAVVEAYEREGAAVRARIERCLPSDWSYDGKRVLDFGCGSARVLRHFLYEAEQGEFWGCDIDAPSIAWINANLSPPLHCFQNAPEPPLALEDDYFDLIWATSVFTHIGHWSSWLLEMHRILAPGGMLIASFLGEGMWEGLVGEPYPEDDVGMAVMRHWEGADLCVFHSEWWLREHWGRAFEVHEVVRPPRDATGESQVTHSYIAMRVRPGHFTRKELERCDPAEQRELAGLQTQVRLLRGEIETLVRERPRRRAATEALRDLVRRSPLAGPARRLRRRVRAAR
jgi:SAM-dependent methyltransferase